MVLPSKPNTDLFSAGTELIYTDSSGGEKLFLKAKVVVVTAGPNSCEVQIVEIIDKGEKNLTKEGDPLIATAAELSQIF